MRNLRRLMNLTLGGGEGWENSPVWDPARDLLFSSHAGKHESVGTGFADFARLYKGNSTVGTCIGIRMSVFSEVSYLWQDRSGGLASSDLVSSPSLKLIEEPWPNGTTGELTARMEQDNSLAGNHYSVVVDGERLRRLHPGYVKIVTGSPSDDPFDVEARPVGYIYAPPGGSQPVLLSPDRVLHYSPLPDPDAQWRGMSWMTPVIEEIMGDSASTRHKTRFFKYAASLGMAVVYDKEISADQIKEYAEVMEDNFTGVERAYKTFHVGGGADPRPVGANLKQLDLKTTQGSFETRIAAASGVGAVIAQLSEGLAGSSLGAGKFTEARKRSETMLFRPLWRVAAASLQSVLEPPSSSHRLTYDTRDVAFLRDDATDEARILSTNAQSIRSLLDAGYTPESAVAAITSGNLALLEHTGLFSVQLQLPGSQALVAVPAAAVDALIAAGWTWPEDHKDSAVGVS